MINKDHALRKKLKAGQAMKGYTNEGLAKKMEMTYGQLNWRFRHPDAIRYKELEKFEKVLGITIIAR